MDCRSQGRQKIRWRDEIKSFVRAGWSALTLGREVENVGDGLYPAVDY